MPKPDLRLTVADSAVLSHPSSRELLDAAYMLADFVRRQDDTLANALIGARALSQEMSDAEVRRAVLSWFS